MIRCQLCEQDTPYARHADLRGGYSCDHCKGWINAAGAPLVECRDCGEPTVYDGTEQCIRCWGKQRAEQTDEEARSVPPMRSVRTLRIDVIQMGERDLALRVEVDPQTAEELLEESYSGYRRVKLLAAQMLQSQAEREPVAEGEQMQLWTHDADAGWLRSVAMKIEPMLIALAVAGNAVDGIREKAEEAQQLAQERQEEVSS